MKDRKHIKTFEDKTSELNIYDVRSSEINTFKIETSIGIIEIPEDAINKEIGNSKEEWVSKLKELYDFVSIYVEPDKEGWLFIELSDGHYGAPEYKIIY